MSLLLDARKKSQQAQDARSESPSGIELSLEDFPAATRPSSEHVMSSTSAHPTHNDSVVPDTTHQARSAGQNLFSAKNNSPAFARASINRNVLIALGGTIILLAAGAGYVWYEITPHRPAARQAIPPVAIPAQPPAQAQPNDALATTPSDTPLSGMATHPTSALTAKKTRKATRYRNQPAMRIEKIQPEAIDPILHDAYRAYQGGQLEQAQLLYQRAQRLDARNIDALLGLAAVAQRQGSDNVAAHYYLKVLELDPRDPVANAGMSALTTGDNGETRLKLLLKEQPDSSALHFALGNRYASQARWSDAQQSYFNAFKLEPKNSGLAFNLAVSLDRLGQNKLAAQYYQRAIDLDPKSIAGFDHSQISQRIAELAQ